MTSPKALWQILRTAFAEFKRENVARLGAGLAYYTLFAMAPLLVVAIGVAGMAFGAEAARGEVVKQIDGLVGRDGALMIQDMLVSVQHPARSVPATILGVITLFLGATSAFAALQGALNEVWNVKEKTRGAVLGFLRGRLLSFSLVLGIGFLLLVSLAMSAALAAFGGLMSSRLPGGAALWAIVNVLISFGFTTILFAMIFKVLPDVPLSWRDVWMGGLITSLFFTLGKVLIGIYLGRSAIGSSFGAAGSIIVVLIWIYYSSQILLFGAEVTQAVVRRRQREEPAGQ